MNSRAQRNDSNTMNDQKSTDTRTPNYYSLFYVAATIAVAVTVAVLGWVGLQAGLTRTPKCDKVIFGKKF